MGGQSGTGTDAEGTEGWVMGTEGTGGCVAVDVHGRCVDDSVAYPASSIRMMFGLRRRGGSITISFPLRLVGRLGGSDPEPPAMYMSIEQFNNDSQTNNIFKDDEIIPTMCNVSVVKINKLHPFYMTQ